MCEHFCFLSFKNNLQVICRRCYEMNTGKVWVSYDDNLGINIEINDKWEALISILVKKN